MMATMRTYQVTEAIMAIVASISIPAPITYAIGKEKREHFDGFFVDNQNIRIFSYLAGSDIHPSNYGRLCPIDTSEGINVGLIRSLTIHSKIGRWGSLELRGYKIEKNALDGFPGIEKEGSFQRRKAMGRY
ncbi:DNA-directed RNA polymerase, subunit 2 [Artemisia annua]|uniref:DNA-directed RNA polymerase n=1 Tax=Artemisia annua TaxID=35608 RepID=A0A2U1MYZ3_ARTAN|nr:DNA-directed RNA polymerase, subunit 2 [Artemisia annua]